MKQKKTIQTKKENKIGLIALGLFFFFILAGIVTAIESGFIENPLNIFIDENNNDLEDISAIDTISIEEKNKLYNKFQADKYIASNVYYQGGCYFYDLVIGEWYSYSRQVDCPNKELTQKEITNLLYKDIEHVLNEISKEDHILLKQSYNIELTENII